ncbi:hypothetical protein I79_023752 [Cricetulus griseus]|uniref:Uncharacterized protein n=1 Tax=Cricetulus griseus TaxID=10029 RepID=G3IIS7_CRIGR|nr:hypothetical protein I79_023752 [Cricetulus griseus]
MPNAQAWNPLLQRLEATVLWRSLGTRIPYHPRLGFEDLTLDVLSRFLKDLRNRTASLGSMGPSTSAVALEDPLDKVPV